MGCSLRRAFAPFRLKRSDTIEELSIEHNGITEKGTHAIAEALTVNNGLRKFYCSGNRLGNAGAELFGRVLRENVAIEHLYLEHTGIDDDGGQYATCWARS